MLDDAVSRSPNPIRVMIPPSQPAPAPEASRSRPGNRARRAFTLVEVTLALGMVTFCLLGLVGLLPLGLTSVKTSRDGAAALNSLIQMSDAIQGAQAGNGGSFKGAGQFSNLEWKVGGPQVADVTKLSALGFPSGAATDDRFVSHVVITPPSQPTSTGTAAITIAWPSQATWDTASGQWKGAQGSVRTWLVFLPATP